MTMDNYILWYNEGMWKLFDPETFAFIRQFDTEEEVHDFIASVNADEVFDCDFEPDIDESMNPYDGTYDWENDRCEIGDY